MRRAEYPDPEVLEQERRRPTPDPPEEYPAGPTWWWQAEQHKRAREEQQMAQQERPELVVVPRRAEAPDPGRWWERAACQGTPTERWFPEHGDPLTQWQFLENQRMCSGCPVQSECLEDAMRVPEARDYGFFGGMSRNQRRVLRAQRARERREQTRGAA